MFNSFSTDTAPAPYNDYGVGGYIPFTIKSVTIGPAAINDATQLLNDKFWAAYYDPQNSNIYLDDFDGNVSMILNEPAGVDMIRLAFDQNANDAYAFITGAGELKVRFFDGDIPGDTIISLGQAQSVTMAMDMKYYPSSEKSDILIFYIRDNAIYYRLQRDKYAVEYVTPVIEDANKLYDSGMRKDYRFQVRWS